MINATTCVRALPNVLTALRILSTPFLLVLTLQHQYGAAALLFFASSWTDFFDGQIARRFHAVTPLGAVLDPIADKLFMLFAYLALAEDFKLLSGLVIGRDVAIVSGVGLSYALHLKLPIKPLMVSKVNTAFSMLFPFVWLLVKISVQGVPSEQSWLPILIAGSLSLMVTFGTLYFVERKGSWPVGKVGLLGGGVFSAAFCLFIWSPVMETLRVLLCPEFLTTLAGIVAVTTVASGLAYALVFLRAWKARKE